METQILEAMNWRYATKKFDPTKKLREEQLQLLLETVRLSASSFGIQPWHFVVVSDKDIKLQLQAAAFGQAQLADCSHVIVFARKLDSDKALDEYITSTAQNANAPIEQFDAMKQYLKGALSSKSEAEMGTWMARQLYIPLGTLLESAALLKIDACPMEGFDLAQFDQILGLKEKGLASLAIITLGYRAVDDKNAGQPKNRLAMDEVVTFIK